MTELYNFKTTPQGYRMVKFDNLLNVLSIYEMPDEHTCSCFQAAKPTCRHREMAFHFLQTSRLNTGWFLNYTTQAWEWPLAIRRV